MNQGYPGRGIRGRAFWGTTIAFEALGIGLKRLYRMIDIGKIPGYKVGRVIRLSPSRRGAGPLRSRS
jgi:excisionase family DNA binding protein